MESSFVTGSRGLANDRFDYNNDKYDYNQNHQQGSKYGAQEQGGEQKTNRR